MRYLCLLLVISFLRFSAQTEIKGVILTESKQPVSKANIILANPQDDILTFVFTNKDGSFLLNTDKVGEFSLQISALGYIKKNIPVSIAGKSPSIDFGIVELETDKVKEIKEIVINRHTPIKLKKDTVEFNAQSFSNGSEQNVEDLLKKIPGITVLSDGKIKFGNKEVSRVMVENDDLFERGYQTLTQNMPAKPLDKIQVLKNYSKNKLIKNIEDTERIAINLTLKENAKGQWFGNVLLASTSYKEGMYAGKLNVMNFTKRKKTYFLVNANNLGLNEMKGVKYLLNPDADNEVENIGTNIGTLSIVNLHQKNTLFEDKRTNFNNDKLASLNYIYNFANYWKINSVVFFNSIENRNYIRSSYKFHYDGLSFTNIEDKTWKKSNRNVVGKLEATKEFTKSSNILFYHKLSSLEENNNNIFLFNDQWNRQIGKNRLFASENKWIYTKKIDSSKAVVAVAKYFYQGRSYDFSDENDIFQYFIKDQNARKLNQIIRSRTNFGGSKISYLKNYAENHSLEIQVGNEFRIDYLSSGLSVYDGSDQEIDFDSAPFRNDFDVAQNNLFARVKYLNRIGRWRYSLTVNNQLISSKLKNQKTVGFYISPAINISYDNKKTGNFSLNAQRKLSTVSINDLYTNFIYQGNRNFKQSEVGFSVLPDCNFGLSYNIGDMMTDYLNFSINYFRSEDYLSNNMIVNPDFAVNQIILVKNNNVLSSDLEVRKYIKRLKSRISLIGSYMLSDYENSINNHPLIKTEFSNLRTGFEMKSGFRGVINYELGYEWIFNKIRSEVNSNSYTDQKGFLNLYFTLNPLFRIESAFEYYKFGNANQSTTQFLDIKAHYSFKKYDLKVFLQGNNLLNSSSITRYSVSNISESLYTQRLMPMHIVFGINKSF